MLGKCPFPGFGACDKTCELYDKEQQTCSIKMIPLIARELVRLRVELARINREGTTWRKITK